MKIEEQLRQAIRLKHYSIRTEECYVQHYKRYVRFHNLRHPLEMGEVEVSAFLSWLAVERHVSASSQNQALSAMVFLYGVLGKPLGKLTACRAKRPARLPVVLTRDEVARVLDCARGETGLILRLLYGTGGRLMEAMRLRLKDLDFARNEISLNETKHDGARIVPLPICLRDQLFAQVERMRALCAQDRANGVPGVCLPDALERKYPRYGEREEWQWLFASPSLSLDKRSGITRRHHLHENATQKAMTKAVLLARIGKPAHVHSLRHAAASHLLEAGYDVRNVQLLLGHKQIGTTMLYAHPQGAIRSPLDIPASNVVQFAPMSLLRQAV